MSILTKRFEEALIYAATKHSKQKRKRTSIPYISHPLAVAAIVIENGGSEDEAIAALLHDVPEDCGGVDALNDIRRRFGDAVANIAADCTDAWETPKPAWRTRKEKYIEHLALVSPSTLLVSSADKLHNARAILNDYKTLGEDLWNRFSAGKESLWYYRALVQAFRKRGEHLAIVDELDNIVTEIETRSTVVTQ